MYSLTLSSALVPAAVEPAVSETSIRDVNDFVPLDQLDTSFLDDATEARETTRGGVDQESDRYDEAVFGSFNVLWVNFGHQFSSLLLQDEMSFARLMESSANVCLVVVIALWHSAF